MAITKKDVLIISRDIIADNGGEFTLGENTFSVDEVLEKLDGMIAQLEKKPTGEKKPTAKQIRNNEFKENIVEWMESDHLYSVAEITKGVPQLVENNITTNMVAPMMTSLAKAGRVVRTEDKRKVFYSLA